MSEWLYDRIALIASILINEFDAEKMYAFPQDSLQDSQEYLNSFENYGTDNLRLSLDALIEKHRNDYVFLRTLLERLDEKAYLEREEELWMSDLSFDDFRCIAGLNSSMSREKLGLLVIPQYECIWSGHSRDENHTVSINTFLKHCFCVPLRNGKVCGKYTVENYIMEPALYGIQLDCHNRLTVSIGISPVTENISLSYRTYPRTESGSPVNYFRVLPFDSPVARTLTDQILRIIRDADEAGADVFVFPEMLGSSDMITGITEKLASDPLQNIKLVVMPSIWSESGDGGHTNISYLINYCGDILFGQDKIKPFPLKHRDGNIYLEDIQQCEILRLLHCQGYGTVAIAICRSELDADTKKLLMHDLNVKLLLCPSWSTGSFEFESSVMTGAELNCNTVWCNTCSALSDKSRSDKVVGIITNYGKNRIFSEKDLTSRKFPVSEDRGCPGRRSCDHLCENNCYDIQKIYGTDFIDEEGVILWN